MPGEEIRVTANDGGTFTAYVSTPPSGGGPGLLVLPEIYNSNEHIRGVADGFAAEGFVTLSPDVFWRLEPDTYLPYTPEGQAKARSLNQRLDIDALLGDLGACLTALKERPDCTGKLGATGFCLGGKLAYLSAARHDIDAAVSYYGVKIDTYLDEVDAITCPILFHCAENDSHVPPEAVAAIREKISGRPTAELFVYDGAEHGFNRKGYPPYHQPSADLAMQRTLAHVRAHLA
jgi:carboxymethylenebutenolidase